MLPFRASKGETTLSLLVENCGRVNYGKALDEQRKGSLPSNVHALCCAIHWFIVFEHQFSHLNS